MRKVHVNIQLNIKVSCFLNRLFVWVQFIHMQSLPKRQLPQPMGNNSNRTFRFYHLYNIYFAIHLTHFSPPKSLYNICRKYSFNKEIQSNKNLLFLLWFLVAFKDYLCLKIGSLVGENDLRVASVEITDDSHQEIKHAIVFYLKWYKRIVLIVHFLNIFRNISNLL